MVNFDEKVVEHHSADYVPETPLEKKMVEALKAITHAEGRKKPKLAKVQLQFPKAASAFLQIKKVFNEYDKDHGGTIDLDELTTALEQLTTTSSTTTSDGGTMTTTTSSTMMNLEEVQDLFAAADVDGNRELTFKEFVVFLCVSSLLGHLNNDDDHDDDDASKGLDAAFRCAVDAFDVFDVNSKGVIVFSEMGTVMEDMASPDLLLARMTEMDQDGNGYVIFPEFLMAFMDWVGIDEEEEEEE